MSLLFWYLPFMIMSGCFEALYENDGIKAREAEARHGWAALMPAALFNNVEHWLERAEKARVHADLLTDSEAKHTMLEIADSYQKLAARAAVHQLSVGLPSLRGATSEPWSSSRARLRFNVPAAFAERRNAHLHLSSLVALTEWAR
jgi:hypothetical protein